ncbi:cytochrome P450 [Phanerochaete sordida]|uniref:Cytochrome P450 n=1 Tax=Phanerochaete sordida TaxID=48140 RepID=A0A9P3G8V7_9APHY|nr:cytochrome P450 [Phanerochaete sordida]
MATYSTIPQGRTGLGLAAILSFAAYFVFKRYEPSRPAPVCLLLIGIPVAISLSTARSSDALAAVPALCLVYWGSLAGLVLAYRISPFHPLARYPGPFLCKLSKGSLAYVTARTGRTYLYLHQLHQIHGDVVRIGPNELSIRHKDACVSVLGQKGIPRGPYYDPRIQDVDVALDGIRDPAVHAIRRRPWARAMNSASMKHYEDLICTTVTDLVNGLTKRLDEPIDIAIWMSFYGFDFMGRMAFTYEYGMLKEGRDTHGLRKMIDDALSEVRWISHVPWSVPLLKLTPGASKNWDTLKAAGAKVALHRASMASIRPDLFHHLMDEEGHEAVKPNLEAVAVDGALAIVAGADTAATTLAHFWYLMLRYPQYLGRLRGEIDAAFALDDGPDFTKQANLPYLNACLNETLRLLPPVLAGLQRRVERGTGGKGVGPYFIPEDTQVTLVAYAIHRSSDAFSPLPETFWPDRWLAQENYTLPGGETVPAGDVRTSREAFMPFSMGPMVCAGKNVALAEIRAVICAMVQRFDVAVTDRVFLDKWEDELQECFVSKIGHLPVKVESRSASAPS